MSAPDNTERDARAALDAAQTAAGAIQSVADGARGAEQAARAGVAGMAGVLERALPQNPATQAATQALRQGTEAGSRIEQAARGRPAAPTTPGSGGAGGGAVPQREDPLAAAQFRFSAEGDRDTVWQVVQFRVDEALSDLFEGRITLATEFCFAPHLYLFPRAVNGVFYSFEPAGSVMRIIKIGFIF